MNLENKKEDELDVKSNDLKQNKNTFKINKKDILKFLKYMGIKFGKDVFKFIFKFAEVALILICFCLFLNWSNDNIILTEDTYINENIPSSFNGYKILQISDFNNKENTSSILIEYTKEVNPDIVVITGDYINSERSTEYNIDYSYIEEIIKKYPIYFITGEQEQDSLCYETFKNKLETLGVEVLDNESIELTKNDDKITLVGLNDSSFFYENLSEFKNKLKELNVSNNFTILLSHRPELIDIYTENNISLVLSGHALGGQIKLPFVGTLYSSNQGFYPNYTNGFYTQNNTTLYVSRGIGNTFIPIRLFNNPEVNVITLKNF